MAGQRDTAVTCSSINALDSHSKIAHILCIAHPVNDIKEVKMAQAQATKTEFVTKTQSLSLMKNLLRVSLSEGKVQMYLVISA